MRDADAQRDALHRNLRQGVALLPLLIVARVVGSIPKCGLAAWQT
jgi:hypothetical protein